MLEYQTRDGCAFGSRRQLGWAGLSDGKDLLAETPSVGAGMAAILGDVGNSTTATAMASRRDRPHVCVVGAGMAGLRCAEVLLENGFKVTILEARKRIGGRVSLLQLVSHEDY